jgi:Fe-S cluster assembly protein SufD
MADVTPIRTAAETALLDLFPAVKARLPGGARAAGEREKAIGAFAETGLPHRRIEAWKYTDLRALLREAAPLAAAPDAEALAAVQRLTSPLRDVEATRLTVVDGAFVPALSDVVRLPAGLEVVSYAEALGSDHPLAAVHLGTTLAGTEDPLVSLNAAFATDGVVVRVARGTALARPVLIRHVTTGDRPSATFTRSLVVVEEGASVTLVESHEGPNGVAHQANNLVEIVVADRAIVNHVRTKTKGSTAVDLSTLGLRFGAHVSYTSFAAVTAAAVSRHQIFAQFAGEHSKAMIAGAALLNGRQHSDTTLVVDHAVPHCESRELFKHVMDGEATGVFQGKIIVRPHAQKTDGRMMSQAVLLADGASMNNKPELEIFADDVQCAHGATCGALDDDLLFYLRARGLPQPEAEALMLQAFVGEAIETVENESLRTAIEAVVEGWLRARM